MAPILLVPAATRSHAFRGLVATIVIFAIFTSLSFNHYQIESSVPQKQENGKRYAFATLLAGSNDNDDDDWTHDNYFIAARILAYQLLHSPETRSKQNIPFLVLVSQSISATKRDRLRKDGATVIEIESIYSDWIQPLRPTYVEVLAKLRLWELTQYERICVLDGDSVLTRPLDDVFDDPAVALRTTGDDRQPGVYREDEGSLPPTYAFSSCAETNYDHGYPPTVETNDYRQKDYLNAGFMVLRPDKELFAHYMRVLSIPDRFDGQFPEQNLLNYVHNRSGNMPWQPLANTWNINFPKMEDVKGGVASMHEKFWSPQQSDLAEYLRSWRWRMEGYFEAVDRRK